jgi:hypothetical protein
VYVLGEISGLMVISPGADRPCAAARVMGQPNVEPPQLESPRVGQPYMEEPYVVGAAAVGAGCLHDVALPPSSFHDDRQAVLDLGFGSA